MPHIQLTPAVPGVPASTRYSVLVNGQPSFTYMTTGPQEAEFTTGHTMSWTTFDTDGPVEVRIRRLDRPVSSVMVRPASAGCQAGVEDGEIRLRIERPGSLCVECDGELEHVLLLFAHELGTDLPDSSDPSVVRFEAGVHDVGKFYRLQPRTTYYLAPGAFLRGSLCGGGEGTRLIGRGVVSGAQYAWPGHLQEKNPERIDLARIEGDGLEVAGVTLVDSPYYVLIAHGRGVRVRGVKVLAWHYNTDAVSTGPDAVITDCFLRAGDDLLKPFVSGSRIERCVLWADRAAAFQLTWNARQDAGGSLVRDCDVIHHLPFCTRNNEWTGAVFWSWHGGTGHIHDLTFEDLRIEGRSPCLINLFLQRNPWSPQDGAWGRFSRLRFRNVSAEQPFLFPSRLLGHDAEHPIDDVIFENLRIAGVPVRGPADMNLQVNEHVRGLRFLE